MTLGLGTKLSRLGAVLCLCVVSLSAQTLQQAEDLWKRRDFKNANEVFKALTERYPDNPDFRVRWGRMYLDHGASADVQNASDLFNEALALKKEHAGAELGLA